jgi:hypothetical protein
MRRVGVDHYVACHHPLIEPWTDEQMAATAVPAVSVDAPTTGAAPTV